LIVHTWSLNPLAIAGVVFFSASCFRAKLYPDHARLLGNFKPAVSISDMLKKSKANSSKWGNEEKLKLRKFGWQDGYAALSVSESQVGAMRQYIRR
jgi:REP element-mobilizing transposase RayT